MTRRVEIAQAALLDIGRPDLAALVSANRAGDPSCRGGIFRWDRPRCDSEMIIAAFRLGHMSDTDGAPVGCDIEGGFPACKDGRCHVCLADPR